MSFIHSWTTYTRILEALIWSCGPHSVQLIPPLFKTFADACKPRPLWIRFFSRMRFSLLFQLILTPFFFNVSSFSILNHLLNVWFERAFVVTFLKFEKELVFIMIRIIWREVIFLNIDDIYILVLYLPYFRFGQLSQITKLDEFELCQYIEHVQISINAFHSFYEKLI